MDISVILATYKRSEILTKTLQSFCALETEGLKWEVLVVDNAGDLDTRNTVYSYQHNLPLKYLIERTAGKNNALNSAIKEATGDLFVFTDDDIIADPRWLIEMWEGSKRWPEFSVFGGRILPDFPSHKIPLPADHYFFNQAYVIADWNLKEGPYEVNKVWGPNMAIRSDIFHTGWSFNGDIGPNGKNYIMGSEGEFTARLERAGFKPVYLPNSLVFHQIRPEQLTYRWLFGRAYRAGRSAARRTDLQNMPTVFKVPKHLFHQFLIILMKIPILFFFNRQKALDLIMQLYHIRGIFYQYKLDTMRASHGD